MIRAQRPMEDRIDKGPLLAPWSAMVDRYIRERVTDQIPPLAYMQLVVVIVYDHGFTR